MSKISGLITGEKVIEVEFPDIDNFKINLCYLGREELMKIRNKCLTYKFNRHTRQREEILEDAKFLEEYTKMSVRGWSGLKMKDLPRLLPVDLTSANNLDEEILYTEEDALDLVKNSTIFDQFITDCMNDFELFSIQEKEIAVKN